MVCKPSLVTWKSRNFAAMKSELSILIPVYNGDCRRQVDALSRQAEAIGGLHYEIIVADDGSTDRSFVERCREVERWPHCRFIDRGVNSGRAAIRNFLAREARYEWLLFMDAEMTVGSERYLLDYLDNDFTDVAYGGYYVGEGERGNLRFIYEKDCEPQHRAEERRKRPFMHFHTSNFVVRRDIMLAHPFDERFRQYGYEDVLWGKQLRQDGITVVHPDNPVGFCTFERNERFVDKTEEALRTLSLFYSDLRGYSKMITFVESIHLAPVRWVIRLWHRLFGALERRNLCGSHPSLRVFKLYKLGYFMTINNNH
ncbi:MAG: glycosyltransferase family 2 protein [Prevotella sp.]|nr:glycosyltransferase family 2 protein [Prevotella sp.]